MDAAADCAATTATAVGRLTKKLSFAHPLARANTNNGGDVVLTGQMTSTLIELTKQVVIKMLEVPILSQVHPPKIRPTTVAAPTLPTNPPPADVDGPTELAKSGKKKGGMKSANTLIAAAMVIVRKGNCSVMTNRTR